MSAAMPKVYRFATTEQWKRCLTHRLEVTRSGIMSVRRLGSAARWIAEHGRVQAVAIDAHGVPLWVTADSEPLGRSPRLVADRMWVWTFEPDGTTVSRYDRDALQHDLTIRVGQKVLDIAGDGHQGIWVLAAAGADAADLLLHYDCDGCPRERHPAPCEAGNAAQLGSVDGGRQLVLLAEGGRRLLLLDAASGAIRLVRMIGRLAESWSASQLSTDTRARIAVWGRQDLPGGARWVLFVLDRTGEAIDGPISPTFDRPTGEVRVTVDRDVVWLATDAGLWRLDPGEITDPREPDSLLLTPALESPDNPAERGWLRAEIDLDLPAGAVLDAQFATTDREEVLQEVNRIAADASTSSGDRVRAIWDLLQPADRRRITVTGPTPKGVPIAIPLFGSNDRWLWLRLDIHVPSGGALEPIRELRVLYPEVSIIEHLPAALRGPRNDPTGALRSLVGVLESTTQRLDARIRGIGALVDPRTARPEWLDYLGRWLDLPWDDALTETMKRDLLLRAGELLELRGTRAGLRTLLRCLVGRDATVAIEDLTVDYPPVRLGGRGRAGGALPALLAGASLRSPILGAKAVLGRARLCGDADPLAPIRPTLAIRITARQETHRLLASLLPRILDQYVPAGFTLRVRWRIAGLAGAEVIGADGIVLGGNGPAALGRDSALGRSLLGGRRGARLDTAGLDIGFRLR